jgi:hypothetical protein
VKDVSTLRLSMVTTGDAIIVVIHPLRLLICRDHCLAFSPRDPRVKNIVLDIAAAIKNYDSHRVSEPFRATCPGLLVFSGLHDLSSVCSRSRSPVRVLGGASQAISCRLCASQEEAIGIGKNEHLLAFELLVIEQVRHWVNQMTCWSRGAKGA